MHSEEYTILSLGQPSPISKILSPFQGILLLDHSCLYIGVDTGIKGDEDLLQFGTIQTNIVTRNGLLYILISFADQIVMECSYCATAGDTARHWTADTLRSKPENKLLLNIVIICVFTNKIIGLRAITLGSNTTRKILESIKHQVNNKISYFDIMIELNDIQKMDWRQIAALGVWEAAGI